MDDKKLANQILSDVGGQQNVESLIHCVTRLRFKLKDETIAKTEDIKQLDGVMTVVQSGGQYQVVIGDRVGDVYDELIPKIENDSELDNFDSKNNTKKSSWLDSIIQFLSALFTPIIGPLAASGILKGFLVLLTMTGILSTKSGTYIILYDAADALYYYLPVLLGFSSAKVFKTNRYMGAILGAALVYPTLVSAYSAGTSLSFLGIPVVLMSYSSTLIPVIVAVWFLSVIEKWLNKVIPRVLKSIFVPLLSLVIVIPSTFLVVGPVTSYLGKWLADGVLLVYNIAPAVAGFFLAGIWQGAVLLGLHWGFIPVFLNNIATKGYDPIDAMLYCTVFGQVGAGLGMFIKSRDAKFKELSLTAVVSGFLGITEPLLYGVTIPHKKSFVMASIGSAFGGAIAGLANAKMYGGFASGGIFGIPMFIGKNGINSEFIGFVLSLIVAFTVALILTVLFVSGVKDTNTDGKGKAVSFANKDNSIVVAPVSGTAITLQNIKDDVFSKGLIGPGIGIEPEDGQIYAPFDGYVMSVFPTKHAIGLRSNTGIELLIHIGIDTVNLKGEPFTINIKENETFSKGDSLGKFDIGKIKEQGYDPTVIVIVSNYDEGKEIKIAKPNGHIKAGDQIIELSEGLKDDAVLVGG